MLLAAAQTEASFAYHSIVAVLPGNDAVVELGAFRRLHDSLAIIALETVTDVKRDALVKEHGLLGDHSRQPAQRRLLDSSDIYATDAHGAACERASGAASVHSLDATTRTMHSTKRNLPVADAGATKLCAALGEHRPGVVWLALACLIAVGVMLANGVMAVLFFQRFEAFRTAWWPTAIIALVVVAQLSVFGRMCAARRAAT